MAISSTLRLHQEESNLRGETVLAGAVGRIRWAASHILVAIAGAAMAIFAAGLVAGLIYGIASGDVGGRLPAVLTVAALQLPAIWMLAAVTVALFGLVPRFTPVAWGVLVAFIALYLLGSLAGLPHWLINLQPFTHAQRMPGQPFDATPVIWLLLIDAVLLSDRVARLPASRSALTDESVAELRQPGAGPRVVHQCRGAGRRKAEVLARAQARLDKLIGLDGPKEQIAVWRTEIQIDQLLAAQGEETSSTNENHMVLEGSPGTAKTSTTRTPHPAVRESPLRPFLLGPGLGIAHGLARLGHRVAHPSFVRTLRSRPQRNPVRLTSYAATTRMRRSRSNVLPFGAWKCLRRRSAAFTAASHREGR